MRRTKSKGYFSTSQKKKVRKAIREAANQPLPDEGPVTEVSPVFKDLLRGTKSKREDE
jgi:hypothetical protein